jgi:signal transduction histidine kinase
MAHMRNIVAALSDRFRRIAPGWGGIGCRVSLFMSAALILVSVLVGGFFLWQGKKELDEEMRSRALYVARDLAALTLDDIIAGNRQEIYKKISSPFAANEDIPSGGDLLYIMVYRQNCELLIGSTANEAFFNSDSYSYTNPSGSVVKDAASLNCSTTPVSESSIQLKGSGIYDLVYPVVAGRQTVGYIRLGISAQRYASRFSAIMEKALVVLIIVLYLGLGFSYVIAMGITKPIQQLSEAAEKLSHQNWDLPIPAQGRDEISRLGQTFNQMAQKLRQREMSLSRGNKDLFILHTAGLDLMESLDVDTLLVKIAARAEDLVRSETTMVSAVHTSDHVLRYLGGSGAKADALKGREDPFESSGIYNWMACYGTPLLIPDAQADFRLDPVAMEFLGIKSIMTVPLWSSNTMTGLLTAVNRKGGGVFDKHDLRLFTVFSNLAGAALQNASLYSDLMANVTELRSAQEQLVHSTKMAAIGELAANVAHEVNNPLTSVLGYTTHLLKTLDLPESPKRMLTMMEQEMLRVRKIIRNLLDFSRQKKSWMQSSDLIAPVRETVAFVKGAAESSAVTIREHYGTSPVIVNMDSNEMKQVFINIINNAFQAMPRGGILDIRVSRADDREVAVEFSDTGLGISADNMKKIFEPFFSTKSGDGTGLGLSISYRIVQNHGGRIEVRSEPGKGTVFTVFLPLDKRPLALQNR